jgi:hypothetical protein
VVLVHIDRSGKPQLTDRICARICARNAAGRVETVETRKLDVDSRRASAEVKTGHQRARETAETHVVLLITQRS